MVLKKNVLDWLLFANTKHLHLTMLESKKSKMLLVSSEGQSSASVLTPRSLGTHKGG
jgi:hypothetical protein